MVSLELVFQLLIYVLKYIVFVFDNFELGFYMCDCIDIWLMYFFNVLGVKFSDCLIFCIIFD